MTDWFGAGDLVADGNVDPELYPPLDDLVAQRNWLAGFRVAWRARTAEVTVEAALSAVLNGRKRLLRQLRAHGTWFGELDHPLITAD